MKWSYINLITITIIEVSMFQSGIVFNPILTEIAIKVRTGPIVMVLMNKN